METKLAVLLFAVVACATSTPAVPGRAVLVHRDESSVVVALKGPMQEARQDFDQKARRFCKGPYKVTAEDRVATGEVVHATKESGTNVFGGRTAAANARRENVYEYQIRFECRR